MNDEMEARPSSDVCVGVSVWKDSDAAIEDGDTGMLRVAMPARTCRRGRPSCSDTGRAGWDGLSQAVCAGHGLPATQLHGWLLVVPCVVCAA